MINGKVSEYRALDDLVLNEELIKIAQTLLSTDDISLTQADAWCKYGSGHGQGSGFGGDESLGNKDQRIHMDYGNHTFLCPNTWDEPEVLSAILYYDDSEICSGGTAIVPRTGPSDEAYKMPYINMPGQAGMEFANQKYVAEAIVKNKNPEMYEFRQKLYEREVKVNFKKGSLLLYRHDVWHRGTEVNEGTSRRVHNFVWKRLDCPWVHTWNQAFTYWNYYGIVEDIIVRSSPLQRSLIGFPKPSDPVWRDKRRIKNVEARYPGIDMSMYGPTRKPRSQRASANFSISH